MLSWLVGSPVKMQPLIVSKLNTVAQIVLVCVVLGSLGFHLSLGIATQVLMYLVAATTLLSVAAYLTGWMRHMNAATAKQ
jgi:cardiolipin synthase